eukprot:s4628_g1.t1
MAVDLVPLPKARDLATRKMVKYALVATALVPVFGGGETSKSPEVPKDPKNGDDGESPKEVVEMVDACWGEGLEEKEFVLQGEPDETGDDPKRVEKAEDELDYEPSIFGDDVVAEPPEKPEPVPDDAGDDPIDPDAQLQKEVEQLSAPLKAMRYAVEERLRGQMNALGSPTQKMLPYQSNVLVKRKRWHNRRDLMPRPFVEAKLLCPSPDMTNGWLVFTTKERQVLHAREAILPDPVGDQVHLQLEEAEAGSKPPRRLHGKQPMPGHLPMRVPLPEMPRDDRGGESSLVFDGSKGPEDTKDETEENDLILKKVKAIVCIAALSTAAASEAFAADLRLKCAQTVLALASCGMAHLESVGCDSCCVYEKVETPWPLLAQHYCPEGCPKFPRAKLAAMHSKPVPPGLPPHLAAAAASSSAVGAKPKPKPKPKPPSLPAKAAAAAAEEMTNVNLAAENAAKERPKAKPAKKMPPLMMRCASSMGEGPSGHKAFLGMLPKYPPARQAAEVAMKSAGGTEQDSMPNVGPWSSLGSRKKVDTPPPPRADSQESLRAHVGLKSELETPRRTRPHGRLVTSQGAAASNSRTLSSGESAEVSQMPTSVPLDETTETIGYAKGGIMERGRAAVGSVSSASSSPPPWDWNPFLQPSMPRSFEPLTEDWPSSEIWSLVTDVEDAEEEEEDENVNNRTQA